MKSGEIFCMLSYPLHDIKNYGMLYIYIKSREIIKNMNKKTLWYIVLVVIVVGGFLYYQSKQSTNSGINGTADVYNAFTPPPISPPAPISPPCDPLVSPC